VSSSASGLHLSNSEEKKEKALALNASAPNCLPSLALPPAEASSLRWHYPDQVPSVGGGSVATLSAWRPKLPLRSVLYAVVRE
jgi:hypothetical protein